MNTQQVKPEAEEKNEDDKVGIKIDMQPLLVLADEALCITLELCSAHACRLHEM
jgi:hypothetical protein